VHTLSAPRVVEGLHICLHVTFLYNWIIFRYKSGYKHRKISCSVLSQNNPSKLGYYFWIFFIFFIIFSVFRILVISNSRPFVDPSRTLTIELDLSQESLRCQPVSKNCFLTTFLVQKPWYGHFHYFAAFWGASWGRALTWGVLRRLYMVPNFSILAHMSFLYNWIIFRHKHRRISCSVKIILKTSIFSDFDPFMSSQQFLCTHKSQILLTNVQ